MVLICIATAMRVCVCVCACLCVPDFKKMHHTPLHKHQSIDRATYWKISTNSLWPGDAIWRHGTRSTLAQVMVCCLTAPSHYLNQCWLSLVGSLVIHLRALLLDDVMIPINKTRLKIAVLKWHLGLPGPMSKFQLRAPKRVGKRHLWTKWLKKKCMICFS